MQTIIKITLEHEYHSIAGTRYQLAKINGALKVNVERPKEDQKPGVPVRHDYQTGQWMAESEAQQLIDDRRYDVTVIPTAGYKAGVNR